MVIYAYPKVNICFKITSILPNNYCEIASRFMLVESANLCDTIEICESSAFKIAGNFDCTMQENTIFKAKEALGAFLDSQGATKMRDSLEFFSIEVDKKIPAFAGLGGGSSDAASYLMAMNEILELNLTRKDLMQVGANVGADVSFFLCDFKSANVFGIGESVEFFSEDLIRLEIITPPIACSTRAVYDEFRAMKARGEVDFFTKTRELLTKDSATLLRENTRDFLNDLYTPACRIYPDLADFAKDGYFFSGSGSSFFRIKNRAK